MTAPYTETKTYTQDQHAEAENEARWRKLTVIVRNGKIYKIVDSDLRKQDDGTLLLTLICQEQSSQDISNAG